MVNLVSSDHPELITEEREEAHQALYRSDGKAINLVDVRTINLSSMKFEELQMFDIKKLGRISLTRMEVFRRTARLVVLTNLTCISEEIIISRRRRSVS